MISKTQLFKKISDRKNKRLVFNLEVNAGFYSEFNNMIFCLIYCLEENISFDIQTNGKLNFYKNGWCDYFLPFLKDIKLPFLDKYNSRPYMINGRSYPIMVPLLKKIYSIDYFTQDFFNQVRADYKYGKTIHIPDLNVNCPFLKFCAEIIKIIYVFNNDSIKEMDALRKDLILPDAYTGLHIRRGDKISEVSLYPEDDYLKLVDEKEKNLFIYTDDYNVIENIRNKHPEKNIYHLTEKTNAGYHQSEFVKLPPLERKKMIINLFANMEILSSANKFIGSLDSNIGMFAFMRRAGKNCIDIKGREWRIF